VVLRAAVARFAAAFLGLATALVFAAAFLGLAAAERAAFARVAGLRVVVFLAGAFFLIAAIEI
jgi:hypothetical protein